MGNGKLSPAKRLLVVVGVVFLVLAIAYVILKTNTKTDTNPNACVNRTFIVGSSGNCISDAQNLINWYAYGIDQPHYLTVNGLFDSRLESTVRNAQSGASLMANGQLNPATWKLLCSSQDAPSWWKSAAKDAGCPQF